MTIESLTWVGILFCLSQSAMFSGLNLAIFSLSRLRLQVESAGGNAAATRVLAIRSNSNYVLTTILWGNVSINVLLTLLTDSVLAGASAFLFSTFFITIFGEIMPQAYFSRNALRMASLLAPILKFYQVLLYPVVKPSSLMLDIWLGEEALKYFRETDLKEVIRLHMLAEETDLGRAEATGALNFLSIDDLPIETEGVPIDPESIIRLPCRDGMPEFPPFEEDAADPFLQKVDASGKSWVVITDETNEPQLVMDADGFLRHTLLHRAKTSPNTFCHRPLIVRDKSTLLGEVITRLHFDTDMRSDELISNDIVLLWTEQPRIITGADLLGNLLHGIARVNSAPEKLQEAAPAGAAQAGI